MSVSASVTSTVLSLPLGVLFGYRDIPAYLSSPNAAVKAISRLVAEDEIRRFGKGQFYKPKKGLLGDIGLSDSEILKSILYKKGKLSGYITGAALFNRMGLTTQLPKTFTVAINGSRQTKDLGTLRLKIVEAKAPITKENVPFLEIMDVLQAVKTIPDGNINLALNMLLNRLSDMSEADIYRMAKLANQYYNPATRALLGLLVMRSNASTRSEILLKNSLSPLSKYRAGLNANQWPEKDNWNIL